MASIRFEAVHKSYGRRGVGPVLALDGIDLDVDDGESLAIVGPSGSGKTTLLRIAAGLEPLSSGSVTIGERDVTWLPAGERNVSMVFQTYALFPHLSVAQNIGFGLSVRKVDKTTAVRRIKETAALVGPMAEVTLVESTGAETFVRVDVAGSTVVARAGQDRSHRVGDRVTVRVASDRWYAFDDASGLTLRSPVAPDRGRTRP